MVKWLNGIRTTVFQVFQEFDPVVPGVEEAEALAVRDQGFLVYVYAALYEMIADGVNIFHDDCRMLFGAAGFRIDRHVELDIAILEPLRGAAL